MKLRKIAESIYDSTARKKISNKIDFTPTVKGLNDNELIGYEWSWKEGEKFSKHDGGVVSTRVSDWEKAEMSAETGRDLVHKFIVKVGNTERTVSSESVLHLLGYVDKSQPTKIPSLISAVKTLAKLQMNYKFQLGLQTAISDIRTSTIENLPKYKIHSLEFRDSDNSVSGFVVSYDGINIQMSNFDRNIKQTSDFDKKNGNNDTVYERINYHIINAKLKQELGKDYEKRRESLKDIETKIGKQESKIKQITASK